MTRDSGERSRSDQHPDHNVQAGELFIASVYNAIKENPALWQSTALLLVYDEHGGIYDHVVPPPARRISSPLPRMTREPAEPFAFDRLGVRVPAILFRRGFRRDHRRPPVFDHASIPATITKFFLGDYSPRSPREANADVFIEPNRGPSIRRGTCCR